MKKLLPIMLLAASTFSSNASAVSAEDMFTKCGIGGMIFKDNGTFAAISNVIWDSGTTAVTSGLAGGAGCNVKDTKSASLILNTYPKLATETAQGSGDTLIALMDIYSCNAQSRPVVLSGIRNDFSQQLQNQNKMNASTNMDNIKNYYNIVSNNVSKSCAVI